MGQIDLPKDEEGWTIFTPSTDSRIMYVSELGDDGTGQIYLHDSFPNYLEPSGEDAFATYAAAFANVRDGYPDFVLFKRGDTFIDRIGSNYLSGRSYTEPTVIGAYGASGDVPLLKCSDMAFWKTVDESFIAIYGLNFYAYQRDPNSVDYLGGATTNFTGFAITMSLGKAFTGLLIEGCIFRFFYNNSFTNIIEEGTLEGVTLYRTQVLDNYSVDAAHAQGMFNTGIDDLIIDECLYDHNGWYDKVGTPGGIGEASDKNHNSYCAGMSDTTFKNSIFSRGSSSGNKFTSKYTDDSSSVELNNNLYLDNEQAADIGGNYANDEAYRFNGFTITECVVTDPGKSNPINRATGIGWGFVLEGINNGTITNNYIIHQDDSALTNILGFWIKESNKNMSINSNVAYGLKESKNLYFANTLPIQEVLNCSFTNNILSSPVDGDYTIDALYAVTPWTFSGNTYYSDKVEGTRFRHLGVEVTLANWRLLTGDNSTWGSVSFVDNTRTIETYMASLGETATLDEFYVKCRENTRYSWDTRFTAEEVNAWIKAGFVVVESSAVYHAPDTFNGSNNKYKLPENAPLIAQDNLEGPFWFTGGVANAVTSDEFIAYALHKDATLWCPLKLSLTLYDALITTDETYTWNRWCGGAAVTFGGDDVTFDGDDVVW